MSATTTPTIIKTLTNWLEYEQKKPHTGTGVSLVMIGLWAFILCHLFAIVLLTPQAHLLISPDLFVYTSWAVFGTLPVHEGITSCKSCT